MRAPFPFRFILLPAVLFLSGTLFLSGQTQDAETIFLSANKSFEEADYNQAALKYRSLVENGQLSPDLFYNLGTALYRDGKPGEAVLWHRRAQFLDATLPEARQNLEFLSTRLGFLEFSDSKLDRYIRSLPPNFGRWFSTIFFWLAILAISAGFVVPRLHPNRSGLIALAIVCLMLAVLANRVGQHRATRLAPENFATVTAMDAVAQTAPTPDAKTVIELPAGSELRILQKSGPWLYVDIPGGLRGWVRSEKAEAVWPIPNKTS